MAKQEQQNKNQELEKLNPSEAELIEAIEIEKAVTQINPKIFHGIDAKKKKEIIATTVSVIATKQHSGPLPSPETFQGYENVLPGAAERIITMAEKQQDHRMGLESKHLNEQLFQSKLGQIFGLVISIVAIGAGTHLTMNGHDTVGGILLGTTLISLVTVFVLGKRAQKK